MQNLILTDEQLEKVVNNVACTEDGLKLLGHLLAKADIYDTSFNGNSKDIYFKGKRDFAVSEIQIPMLTYAKEKYIELIRKGDEGNDNSR